MQLAGSHIYTLVSTAGALGFSRLGYRTFSTDARVWLAVLDIGQLEGFFFQVRLENDGATTSSGYWLLARLLLVDGASSFAFGLYFERGGIIGGAA